MKRKPFILLAILLLAAAAGALLVVSRADHEVSLDSVLETWADLIRDADRIGLSVTRVSARREMEIGREIEPEVLRRWQPIDEPALQVYVSAVGQALTAATRRQAIRYHFQVLDAPMVNAFAVPGGGIYITREMLKFLDSEAELAAILGHEIAHVDLRHCIERLQYELMARKLVGRELAMIARLGYELVHLGFSEQTELEADADGTLLAAKAGYDPRAAKAIFERLKKLEELRSASCVAPQAGGGKPPSMLVELGEALEKAWEQYFATHPPTQARIRQLAVVLDRNTQSWQGREFYVGQSNYRDRIPRTADKRPGEWRRL